MLTVSSLLQINVGYEWLLISLLRDRKNVEVKLKGGGDTPIAHVWVKPSNSFYGGKTFTHMTNGVVEQRTTLPVPVISPIWNALFFPQ